jgi:hypothetical protein
MKNGKSEFDLRTVAACSATEKRALGTSSNSSPVSIILPMLNIHRRCYVTPVTDSLIKHHLNVIKQHITGGQETGMSDKNS